MTVLILATERDISADRMVRALADRDVPVFRADLSWFPQQLSFDAELRDGRWAGRLATPYREVTLEELRSAWYRNPSNFRFPAAMSTTERRHAQHEAKLGLGGVLGALPVRWVNHPSRHADAGYKPCQLVAAARAGLSVTPTLVTNNPDALRRFAERSGPGGVVTKMLGASAICEQGGRRVALTQRLTDADLDDLRGIELTAHLVQQWASKREEARVIVIGRHVFAVAIRAHSHASYVDWRADYNALSYEPIPLPAGVEHGIRAVMRELGLVYGAFDFRDHPGSGVDLPGSQPRWPIRVPRRSHRRAADRHPCRSARPGGAVNDWADRAAGLAEELVTAGKLHTPEWIAAVRAIPRHELVPVVYEQDPGTGAWLTRDATDPVWQERIYANRGLFTKIDEAAGSWGTAVVGLSSSSTPGLMTRMLEALDVREGHDVLEIGTGAGYNAALLAHRLGSEHVFSIDIDPELVDLARDRLARIRYRPTLVVADGTSGLPEHAPYDRIIATCSVPAIPRAWLEQTRIGGLILADLKLSVHAGNLVLLTRLSDRAEGRFDRTWAGFMALRRSPPAAATAAVTGQRVARDRAQARPRSTDLGQLRPWDNLLTWFLAQLAVPGEIGYGHTVSEERPGDVFLTSADGSWCEVSSHTDNGTRQVWEAGPTSLWRAVEDADRRWHEFGRPGWDRFGLTATTEQQWIWLDSPNGDHTWPLTGSAAPRAGRRPPPAARS